MTLKLKLEPILDFVDYAKLAEQMKRETRQTLDYIGNGKAISTEELLFGKMSSIEEILE